MVTWQQTVMQSRCKLLKKPLVLPCWNLRWYWNRNDRDFGCLFVCHEKWSLPLKACLSVCNVRSSPSDKSFIMLRYLDGGQLVHYVGNYIETTISNQSWVPKARSETLRAPQNIPARLHPCPTILLGLVAKNLSIASTALVRSYFYDKLLTRCNHLQKYLDKDHVRISWQEKLWHTHGKDLAELSNTREEQGGLG